MSIKDLVLDIWNSRETLNKKQVEALDDLDIKGLTKEPEYSVLRESNYPAEEEHPRTECIHMFLDGEHIGKAYHNRFIPTISNRLHENDPHYVKINRVIKQVEQSYLKFAGEEDFFDAKPGI